MASAETQHEKETFLLDETPHENGDVRTENASSPITIRAIIKNLLVISFAFLFLFTAFQSLQVGRVFFYCFYALLSLLLLLLMMIYLLLLIVLLLLLLLLTKTTTTMMIIIKTTFCI